jgi:hypothetical protein
VTTFTELIAAFGSVVAKYTGKAMGGPAWMARAIGMASLTVAESMLRMLDLGLAEDVTVIRDSIRAKFKAKGEIETAKAEKMMAEAAEVVARSNLHNRNDRIAQAEMREAEANARKAEAQAAKSEQEVRALELRNLKIEAKIEAQKIERLDAAQARAIRAIEAIRAKGGAVGLDPKNLQQFMDANRNELGEASPPKSPRQPRKKKSK